MKSNDIYCYLKRYNYLVSLVGIEKEDKKSKNQSLCMGEKTYDLKRGDRDWLKGDE